METCCCTRVHTKYRRHAPDISSRNSTRFVMYREKSKPRTLNGLNVLYHVEDNRNRYKKGPLMRLVRCWQNHLIGLIWLDSALRNSLQKAALVGFPELLPMAKGISWDIRLRIFTYALFRIIFVRSKCAGFSTHFTHSLKCSKNVVRLCTVRVIPH